MGTELVNSILSVFCKNCGKQSKFTPILQEMGIYKNNCCKWVTSCKGEGAGDKLLISTGHKLIAAESVVLQGRCFHSYDDK